MVGTHQSKSAASVPCGCTQRRSFKRPTPHAPSQRYSSPHKAPKSEALVVSKRYARKEPSAHVFLDQMLAHKFWLGKYDMPLGNPAPRLYHCRSHSCMSSIFSVSASPFLASAVPYSSSSIYFHAISPHVSLHSWTKHTNFFIMRKKSVLSYPRVDANTNLTGKRIFLDQIVPTPHTLT